VPVFPTGDSSIRYCHGVRAAHFLVVCVRASTCVFGCDPVCGFVCVCVPVVVEFVCVCVSGTFSCD
jgi:hypothetical protein